MIPAEKRNSIRIVELPACKMVWSGVCTEKEPFSENSLLRRFEAWWYRQDALRKDRFYARDFMWWDEQARGFAWGLAVSEIPEDTGGYEVIDFPGGLYAVANFVDDDSDPGGGLAVYTMITDWLQSSGCFEADKNRYCLNHFIGTPKSKEAMGYGQQDLYTPIRIKEGFEK